MSFRFRMTQIEISSKRLVIIISAFQIVECLFASLTSYQIVYFEKNIFFSSWFSLVLLIGAIKVSLISILNLNYQIKVLFFIFYHRKNDFIYWYGCATITLKWRRSFHFTQHNWMSWWKRIVINMRLNWTYLFRH